PISKRSHFYPTFYNLDAATEAPDYITYKLVATTPDCLAACDAVSGCNFVNIYNDVNGKNGSTLLTCSMYKDCHYADTATNKGGQTQPDGQVDYITNSDGWCQI
ncbi:fruit-body specific protein A, partial [Amanita rubescens]